MGAQPRFVTKEEAHKLIDDTPCDKIFILRYKTYIGISNSGKHIKKKKGKRMINKANVLILSEDEWVTRLNLHKFLETFPGYKRENIVNSILLPKLE